MCLQTDRFSIIPQVFLTLIPIFGLEIEFECPLLDDNFLFKKLFFACFFSVMTAIIFMFQVSCFMVLFFNFDTSGIHYEERSQLDIFAKLLTTCFKQCLCNDRSFLH